MTGNLKSSISNLQSSSTIISSRLSESAQLESRQASAPLWATLVATFFGAGKLKPGPGTWGSLAALALWAAAAWRLPFAWQGALAATGAALAIAFGIPAGTRVARASGRKDPSIVVIDEVAGQWITMIAVPLGWKTLLAGLILFRAFDIVKPAPLRRLEQFPEGLGIMLDDVGAGVYAWLALRLLLYFGVV